MVSEATEVKAASRSGTLQIGKFTLIPFSLFGELIKGKQTTLLVYTAVFTYLISAWRESIDTFALIWLIIGLFLAISGSTMLNMVVDQDIDAQMERTKNRPLPSEQITSLTVLIYGTLFTVTGILIAGLLVNRLTGVILFLGFFFDVIVYSIWLKRRTRLSIIFGGIAGGLPALAGRTAAINRIDLIGILFLLFILCWIPLHILSLSLIPSNYEGYLKAQIPMWPVAGGKIQTMRVITVSAFLDAAAIIATALLLEIHFIILIFIIILSGFLFYLSLRNVRQPSDRMTFRIFKFASMYMALAFVLLFLGVAIV
ncbi:MAG: heme o synthase [Candidatus Hodarchaeota archaeon]